MSLIEGSASGEVPAGIDACWEVVADLSRAPEWQQGITSVDVVERDGDGRPLICDVVIDAKFREVRCRVRCSFDAPHRTAFERQEQALAAGHGTRAAADVVVSRGPDGSWSAAAADGCAGH